MSRMPKLFAGEQVRRLRLERGMTQRALSRALGLSPSYVNQIERDQRPLPTAALEQLCTLFGVRVEQFLGNDQLRLAQDLAAAMADPLFDRGHGSLSDAERAIRAAPEVAHRFLQLYQAYLSQAEQMEAMREATGAPAVSTAAPYDDVRDWVQSRTNYFDALDRAAEALSESAGFDGARLREGIVRRLAEIHGITVADDPDLLRNGSIWQLRRGERQLQLAEGASVESRVFWMGHVLALLEHRKLIEREVRHAKLATDEARALARVSLANYFAGALMMPYSRFLAAAEGVHYDLERLQSRFGTSFEQVCHRLSTMQRPDSPGIPFYFVKTDIAGNVLKRSSATRFHFARFGGPCPLWNVYRAFASPGRILVQQAQTPDDVAYLNIARTVGRDGGFYLARPRAVAVVLGCELGDASRTVYATGLDLGNPGSITPIGPGCRVCERTACRHRALPPVGRILDVSTDVRGMVPYRIQG